MIQRREPGVCEEIPKEPQNVNLLETCIVREIIRLFQERFRKEKHGADESGIRRWGWGV